MRLGFAHLLAAKLRSRSRGHVGCGQRSGTVWNWLMGLQKFECRERLASIKLQNARSTSGSVTGLSKVVSSFLMCLPSMCRPSRLGVECSVANQAKQSQSSSATSTISITVGAEGTVPDRNCASRLSARGSGYSEWRTKPSEAVVLSDDRDLREAKFDVPLSIGHYCVWLHRWAQ
jgi:hypothetical protein